MEIRYGNGKEVQPDTAPQPVLEEEEEYDIHNLREAPKHPRPGILKVSARSRPSSVAGAIAGVVREAGRADVQAIGAGATNQAIKAIAIARSYLQEDGIDIVCIPVFAEVIIEQEERTALRFLVEKRS